MQAEKSFWTCRHMRAANWIKKYAALQTAGEITVKRSRPVEKYRQIYYMTYYHKNQDVIFNISQKSKNHH